MFHRCIWAALACLLPAATLLAQHDYGRNAVQQLARGNFQQGMEMASADRQAVNSRIGKAEALFVQSLAASLAGDGKASLDFARQAVAHDLPFARLLAGPRAALATLHKQPEFPAWAKEQNLDLLHGPLLGDVTESSARFWVRTASAAEVSVEIVPVDAAKKPAPITASSKTTADADYTALLRVDGLNPDTQYRYTLSIDGRKQPQSHGFRTMTPAHKPAAFRVAFGGGAGFMPDYERMWNVLAEHDLRAMLLLGDNVYIDDPTHRLTQRYCYYRRQSRPEWRRFTARTPIYAIYDDHDFGDNDCVPGPLVDQPAWKTEVVEVFRQNWNNPAYADETHPGCWFDFYLGEVHFILLDGRYYRDLKGGSMLGPVQKAWLLETLSASRGTFKVLASPVPWSPGVKSGSKDTWDGFRDEREEIFSHIAREKIAGIVLIAADRHRSDLRRIARPDAYALYEAESSRLTNVHTHDLDQNAKGSEFLFGYNKKCSFGRLDFDTTKADPEVTYRIFSIDNEPIAAHTLRLSQLSLPKE